MKTKNLLLLFLLSISVTGYCEIITITTTFNTTTQQYEFSQPNVTITEIDQVRFTLSVIHSAVEVSQATYDANGIQPLAGGFAVGLGGNVLLSPLSVGTHYYVCTNIGEHALHKGTIAVTALGVNDFQLVKNFTVFPNPATDFVNIRAIDSSFGLPYRLMDELGRGIFMGKLNEVTTIDLTQLTSGVYFLQVGDDRRQTFKLLKN